MLLHKTFAPWLLLAFLGQQVSLSSGSRNKNREADKTATLAQARPPRSGDKLAASGRGKFTEGGKMQCTWKAKDVGETVRVSVKCEDPVARIKGGLTDLECYYNAKPHSCPGYQSNPKGFWKQVARALKKLKDKVCRDDQALVRTAMCKRSPRDAHFKLDIRSAVASAQSGGDEYPQPSRPQPPHATAPAGQACAERADHRKTAEENCGSWVSLCNFFLSMLQSDNC